MPQKNKGLLKRMKGHTEDEKLFTEWVQQNCITEYLGWNPNWKKVTRRGLRGIRSTSDNENFPLYDHCDLWRDSNGKKVLTSQPYSYFPGDYIPENNYGYDSKEELEAISKEKFDKLINWCRQRNLEVKFFSSEKSFYNPGKTILIEIREEQLIDNN